MSETIRGTYRTTQWDEQAYNQVEHGPRLAVAEKELAVDGGLQASGILRYSIAYLPDGSNQFTGHVSMTGRIGDRAGSFVVEDRGSGGADGASGTWTVVPGSASGDLAGLSGEGTWTWAAGSQEVAYTLDYEL